MVTQEPEVTWTTKDSKAVQGPQPLPPSLKTSPHTYDRREVAGPQVRGQPSSEGLLLSGARSSGVAPGAPALFVILQELQLVIGVGPFDDVHEPEGGAEDLPTFLEDVRALCSRPVRTELLRACPMVGEGTQLVPQDQGTWQPTLFTPISSPESGSTAAPPLRVNFILFSDLLVP